MCRTYAAYWFQQKTTVFFGFFAGTDLFHLSHIGRKLHVVPAAIPENLNWPFSKPLPGTTAVQSDRTRQKTEANVREQCAHGTCISDSCVRKSLEGVVGSLTFPKLETQEERCWIWVKQRGEQLNASKINKNTLVSVRNYVSVLFPTVRAGSRRVNRGSSKYFEMFRCQI